MPLTPEGTPSLKRSYWLIQNLSTIRPAAFWGADSMSVSEQASSLSSATPAWPQVPTASLHRLGLVRSQHSKMLFNRKEGHPQDREPAGRSHYGALGPGAGGSLVRLSALSTPKWARPGQVDVSEMGSAAGPWGGKAELGWVSLTPVLLCPARSWWGSSAQAGAVSLGGRPRTKHRTCGGLGLSPVEGTGRGP